jgi:hypothetical protein
MSKSSFLTLSLRSQNEMFDPLSKCVPVSYSLPAVATCVSLIVRVVLSIKLRLVKPKTRVKDLYTPKDFAL